MFDPQALIAKALQDGVEILPGEAPGRIRLVGPTDALARWSGIVARHKAALLPLVEAANDGMSEAQDERAAILQFEAGIDPRIARLLAAHGGDAGVQWHELALIDDAASKLWIVQRPSDGRLTVLATVESIPKPRSYPAAWAARWATSEPTDDAAPAAAEAARVVQRARWCWGCRMFSALSRPNDRTPQCASGHPLVWRIVNPGHRAMPGRADATGCCDYRPRGHA